MEKQGITESKNFCWNKECPEYGKIKPRNIRKYGNTQKGTPRFQCKTCKKVAVETIGTIFYGLQYSAKDVIECFALLADRNSLAAIHRIKGIKEETVVEWLLKAKEHMEQIEEFLLANYKFSRIQLDAMWSYAGNKGKKKWASRNT
jgi:transposase-like protein